MGSHIQPLLYVNIWDPISSLYFMWIYGIPYPAFTLCEYMGSHIQPLLLCEYMGSHIQPLLYKRLQWMFSKLSEDKIQMVSNMYLCMWFRFPHGLINNRTIIGHGFAPSLTSFKSQTIKLFWRLLSVVDLVDFECCLLFFSSCGRL